MMKFAREKVAMKPLVKKTAELPPLQIVGFTGSVKFSGGKQFNAFVELIKDLLPTSFHHGDCIGWDRKAHFTIKKLFDGKVKIHIHPPENPRARAFCKSKFLHKEKSYLERNHDIVNCSRILVACPKDMKEKLRSGTWSTIRYAKKLERPIYIVFPNGQIRRLNIKRK